MKLTNIQLKYTAGGTEGALVAHAPPRPTNFSTFSRPCFNGITLWNIRKRDIYIFQYYYIFKIKSNCMIKNYYAIFQLT